jgi:hypothetical protein
MGGLPQNRAARDDDLWKFGLSYMWFALALIFSFTLIPLPAGSAITVVCGPPALDGKECCPVVRQIY